MTYSEHLVINERKKLVNRGQIFWKPVQDVSDEVSIKEVHSSVYNVGDHVFVEINGSSSNNRVETYSFKNTENRV